MLGIIAILLVMLPCAYKIGHSKGRLDENKRLSKIPSLDLRKELEKR